MAKSIVYFASARAKFFDYDYGFLGKFEEILNRVNLKNYITKGDYVPIKMHLGSQGAYRVVRPAFIRKLVDSLKNAGGDPFVTDTVRIPGLEYLRVASANGINELSTGAPVIMADGVFGSDSVMMPSGPILGEIGIASAIHDAPAMIVLSHCKGHIASGYGGAVKNLGMGGIAFKDRNGVHQRGRMHFLQNAELNWTSEKCSHCLQCVGACPHESISFDQDEMLVIDQQKCARCGRCARVCTEGALVLPLNIELFQKVLAEAAATVLNTFNKGKVLYINFVTEVQPECDCMPMADAPLIPDIGVLVSDDIVAIEKATLDLINQAQVIRDSKAGEKELTSAEHLFLKIHGKDPYLQVQAMADFGLGSEDYEIVEVLCKPKADGSTAPRSFGH
ncbi:DUF362 domain-containing protein [Desulfosporosinus sp. BG]|uniref:DUF362 domain-containing protein n=1 Tax=Desulfosporosinus sp. BG TaxID=1633135 RepID=UPI00083A637E|nr:DUF362 domain-containing protein [Desulfosporosinus sp. BG]ODA40469.1 Ferredoxin [Desulfosporosinus sp. BG]